MYTLSTTTNPRHLQPRRKKPPDKTTSQTTKTYNPKVQFQIFCSIKCFQKNKALKNPDNWHQTGQGIISPNIIKQWEKS